MRSPDERGQGQVAAAMPNAGVAEVPLRKGRGNAGPVERVEKQKQLSHSFHRPLEISHKARDFHIPTAQLRGHGKVENQNQVSHFPTAARDNDFCSHSEKQNQRKEVGRCAASSFPIRSFSGRTEPVSCSSFDWKMLAKIASNNADLVLSRFVALWLATELLFSIRQHRSPLLNQLWNVSVNMRS